MTASVPRGCRRVRRGAGLVAAAALVVTALAVPGPAAADGHTAVPLTTGADDLGQQGNGPDGARIRPGPVDGPPAAAMASGRDHAYLLDGGGRVWSWGANDKGQLGDGSRVQRSSPVDIGLDRVVEVEAGHYHGIALRDDGTVWTWGYGWLGQLGTGERSVRTRPVRVPGLAGVTAVAAGRDMSYALFADGTVAAWGNNAYGEVGDGTTTRRLSPVPVTGLTDVVELAGGRDHGLARTAAGAVWAWGDDRYGQVGDGAGDGASTRRTTPVRVVASGVAALDAGAHHSVAVTTGGEVLAWGRGYRGQLGLGDTADRSVPTPVPGLPEAVEVGDGRDQSFAVTAAGEVWAWGQNSAGQLGDGTTTRRTRPVKLAVTGIAAVQSGSSHTVMLPAEPGPPEPAPPAGVDVVGATSAAANAVTHRLRLPAGLTAGDGLVLTLSLGSDRTVEAPSGWVEVTTVADRELRTVVWRREARAGDAGATVAVGLSGRAKATLVAAAYRGTASGVVGAAETAIQTGRSATHTAPPVAVADGGSRVLTLWAVKSSSTTTLAPPSGSGVLATPATGGNGRVVALVTDAGPVPAGVVAARAATGDTSAGKATMVSLVVAPAE